jgi:hypothetical protein
LKGCQALVDDPFASPPRKTSSGHGSAQRTPTGHRHKRGFEKRGSDSSDWRRSSDSSDDLRSTSKEKSDRSVKKVREVASDKSVFADEVVPEVENNDLSDFRMVKDENSQSIFPPSCCVFVAK